MDIDLDIRLESRQLRFKLNHVQDLKGSATNPGARPGAFEQPGLLAPQVTAWLDLGFDGVFGEGGTFEATGDHGQPNRKAPAPADRLTLPTLPFSASVASTTDGNVSPTPSGTNPESPNFTVLHELPGLLGIPELTSPAPSGGIATNNTYHFRYNSPVRPNLFFVQILEPQLGPPKVIYQVFVPGQANSFRLPDFPTFAQFPPDAAPVPYPSGQYIIQIIALLKPGVSINNFSYNDFGNRAAWRAYSISQGIVTF